jgi:hypothetical protein
MGLSRYREREVPLSCIDRTPPFTSWLVGRSDAQRRRRCLRLSQPRTLVHQFPASNLCYPGVDPARDLLDGAKLGAALDSLAREDRLRVAGNARRSLGASFRQCDRSERCECFTCAIALPHHAQSFAGVFA